MFPSWIRKCVCVWRQKILDYPDLKGKRSHKIHYLFLCEFAKSNVAYVVNSDKPGSENSKLKVKMLAMSTICFIWEEDLWYARVKLRMGKLFHGEINEVS